MDGTEVPTDEQTPRVRFPAAAAVAGTADVLALCGSLGAFSQETIVLGRDPGGGGHLGVRREVEDFLPGFRGLLRNHAIATASKAVQSSPHPIRYSSQCGCRGIFFSTGIPCLILNAVSA